MNKTALTSLWGYSLIHGIIDLCCITLLFSTLINHNFTAENTFISVVVYNLIAFGAQTPFGFLVDKYQVPKESAFIGCLLVLLSFLVFNNPALAIIITAMGNAFFHVGGGSISLSFDPKKASAPGIFVAPGALGLTLGTLIGKSGYTNFWPFILLLIISGIFIIFSSIPHINYKQTSLRSKINYFDLVVILLLFSVAIRSLYGLTAVFTWKSDIVLLFTLTIAIVAGKMLGGIIADKFGWTKTAIFSLLISAPLLAFFPDNPWLAIMGSFLFQITMPITVTMLSNMLPGKPATAFGLTVLALIIGAIPTYMGIKPFLNTPVITLILIIFSASFLFISCKFLQPYSKNHLKVNL